MTQTSPFPLPPVYEATDVARLRAVSGRSRSEWARGLGVSASTANAWENGRHSPNGPARRLLQIVELQGFDFVADC